MEIRDRHTSQPVLIVEDIVAAGRELGHVGKKHDLTGFVSVPFLLGNLLAASFLEVDLNAVAVICGGHKEWKIDMCRKLERT